MNTNWPTILYFGNDWSADNRTSSHHIAKRLIRDHRVVYIECPGLRAPTGSGRDIKKIFSKTFKALRGPQKVGENFHVYTLFQIPFHRYKIIRTTNEKLIVFQLRQLCKQLNIKNPIVWFVVPHLAMVVGELNESLDVYYCIDDYSSLPGVNKDMIQTMDDKMSKDCDLVFVASQPLYENKKHYGEKVQLSRHGVDFDHFNQVLSDKTLIADEIKHLSKPVIGFFGLIESWVDLNLVKYVAQARPHWNFLMIGRVAISQNPCQDLKNVHFIGSRPYEELPQFAKAFDVAIIPCQKNELIYNFNPLKLREYLAMGTPVVSIRFPEIAEFLDVVEVGDDYNDFLNKIEFALATNSHGKTKNRIDKVRGLSWENRYATIISIVDKILNQKSNHKTNEGVA